MGILGILGTLSILLLLTMHSLWNPYNSDVCVEEQIKTLEERTSARADDGIEISLSNHSVFRGNSVIVRLYTNDSLINGTFCTISFSRDNATWTDLPTRRVADHFEALFETSHATETGVVYFKGRVSSGTGGEILRSRRVALTIRNNPPVTFLSIEPSQGIVGGTLTLYGGGSYDLDGSPVLYRWFLNENELGTGTEAEWAYRITDTFDGHANFSLEVIDDDGGNGSSKNVFVQLLENRIIIGNISLRENGVARNLRDGHELRGISVFEGYFSDRLGFHTLNITLYQGEKIVSSTEATIGVATAGGFQIWRNRTGEELLTFWSYDLDTRPLKDGDYVLRITADNGAENATARAAFEIRNSPSPVRSHANVLFLIGIGIIILAAMICCLTFWRGKVGLRRKLESLEYEFSEVFKHVPRTSIVASTAVVGSLMFNFILVLVMTEGLITGSILLGAIALCGIIAHGSLARRSPILVITGVLCLSGTGAVFFWLFFDDLIWASVGIVIFSVLSGTIIVIHMLWNRELIIYFQNRVENTTSVGTNMTLNAFRINRDRKAPDSPRPPSIGKPGRYVSEWKKKTWNAHVFGKISYTRFNSREVSIGVFDVENWKNGRRLAGIMLDRLLWLMRKKEYGDTFATTVSMKLLSSDPAASYKKDIALRRGFRRKDGEGDPMGEKLILDLTK